MGPQQQEQEEGVAWLKFGVELSVVVKEILVVEQLEVEGRHLADLQQLKGVVVLQQAMEA